MQEVNPSKLLNTTKKYKPRVDLFVGITHQNTK